MLGYGGREKVVIDLANGLCDKGHKVLMVTLSDDENHQAKILNPGIKFFALPASYAGLGGMAAIGYWRRCLPVLIKILKAEQPDIVHTHLFFQRLLFAAVAIKSSGIKARHFQTMHTSGLYYKEGGIKNAARLRTEKIAIKLNRAFLIAISAEVYKNTVKHFENIASGIALIYNGVNEKQFDYTLKNKNSKAGFALNDNDIVVTYVARITDGKDHLTLLKAWKQVVVHSPNAKLILAGDGELKNQMLDFCKQEKIDNSVLFPGMVTNVPALLAITDIGVFTSLFEGFGIAVFEQMLMKIPVVATDIAPINDFIVDGENGFLFQPGNISALASLITILINDAALCTTIGEAGYVTAQQFSMEAMINKHEEVYGYH